MDAKKGKTFSKMSRLITVAARLGGGDPDANATLRLAVDRAKEARMPKENIDRAIKKGTGELAGENFEEAVYEGYGPEGVAFLIKALTDNKNRTAADVRFIFDRHGGSLGGAGSTAYIFGAGAESPSFEIEIGDSEKVKRIVALIDALEENDDVQEVYANFTIPQELESHL